MLLSYYAHYNEEKNIKQLLSEHLQSVSRMAADAVPPTVQFPGMSSEELKKLIRLEGLFHDFGKYTDFFQKYLIEKKVTKLKGHSHISACLFYHIALEHLDLTIGKRERLAWAFLFYLVLRQHHGHLTLKNLFDYEEMWEILQKQANNLTVNGEEILQDFRVVYNMDTKNFLDYLKVDGLQKDEHFFLHMPIHLTTGRLKKEHWYFSLIFLFSVLIDADKWDSAGLERKQITKVAPEEVTNYLRNKHKNSSKKFFELNKQRETARSEILGAVQGLTNEEITEQCFFTLTAPTGIGKTLASLQCAMLLQERIQLNLKYTPRIITAIPFINIIEQTKTDYEKVFGNQVKVRTHHRLTDFSVRREKTEDEMALDQCLMEVESWEADVILTTFVQLFQSLLSGENRLLKKINKLAGSIVILDEIQAIPDKYMPLIGAVLRKVSNFYGTRFILMTATQPKLLELGDKLLGTQNQKPIELLPSHENYFRNLERTKFVPLLREKLNSEQFVSLVMKLWKGKKSALIVVNTIKRSIDIFNLLKKRKKAGNIPASVSLHYLSTNIVPEHRKRVIEEVRGKLENDLPIILVSTQTIEAGVDLDFDMGFRDLAPLESLVQTAGRVNREGRKGEYAPLYIIQLEGDYQRIYKLHHLDRTRRLLESREYILEPEYRKIIDLYYQEMADASISDESQKLWDEGVIGLDFDKLKEFQLIEKLGEVVDIFVEFDEKATLLANAYEELMHRDWKPNAIKCFVNNSIMQKIEEAPSNYERKALLQLILAKMSNYMVQVRVRNVIKNRPISFSARNEVEADFLWIPPGEVYRYYDCDTGFKDESGDAFII